MSSFLLKGNVSSPFPKWSRIIIVIVGLALFAYSIVTFFSSDMKKLIYTFPYTVIALGCVFVAGFEKRTYLTEEGITREYFSWGSKGRDQYGWDEITEVRLKRGKDMDYATFIKEGKNLTIAVEGDKRSKLLYAINNFLPDAELKEFTSE